MSSVIVDKNIIVKKNLKKKLNLNFDGSNEIDKKNIHILLQY